MFICIYIRGVIEKFEVKYIYFNVYIGRNIDIEFIKMWMYM